MVLPLLLIAAPSVKYSFEFVSHHVVSFGLEPFTHLIHDFQEGDNSLIWEEVDARVGQQSSVLFFVHFENGKVDRHYGVLANASLRFLLILLDWG